MKLIIERGDPEEARVLLEESHTLMESLFPSESNHYLSISALKSTDIRFFVARHGTELVGCGALSLKGDYGEVKSMFTATSARGRGVGDAVLAHISEAAAIEGLAVLRLETGYLLEAAHRLYKRHGFEQRGPFGEYQDDPNSLFMEKAL